MVRRSVGERYGVKYICCACLGLIGGEEVEDGNVKATDLIGLTENGGQPIMPATRIRTFSRYQANLKQIGDYVYSYGLPVAEINRTARTLRVPKWHSVTTSKHVNYAARNLGLSVVLLYKK